MKAAKTEHSPVADTSAQLNTGGETIAHVKDQRPENAKAIQLQAIADAYTFGASAAVTQLMPRGRGHAAATYVVTVSHANANGGNAVTYYRDNVQGHGSQAAVIAAAVQAFKNVYGNLANIRRRGRVAPGGAPAGATAV